jgi:hypothetical protein
MSVVTLSEEWPRCRESQVICAPLSRARLAKVCRKLWKVRFSSVGPTRVAGLLDRTVGVAKLPRERECQSLRDILVDDAFPGSVPVPDFVGPGKRVQGGLLPRVEVMLDDAFPFVE